MTRTTLTMITGLAIIAPLTIWALAKLKGRKRWTTITLLIIAITTPITAYAHQQSQTLHAAYDQTQYQNAQQIQEAARLMDLWDMTTLTGITINALAAGALMGVAIQWVTDRLGGRGTKTKSGGAGRWTTTCRTKTRARTNARSNDQ